MSREIQEKDEEKQSGKWKRVGRFCLKYPVSVLFALAIAYYAVQAYVFGISPFINRLIVYGLVVLWILWLVARHMVKLFLLLLFAGVLLYGWNWYATREIRKCEESGRIWNEETKACEEKKTIMQRIELLLNKYLSFSESQKHE